MEARTGDESGRLWIGRNPWTEQTLDVAAGRNKPANSRAEQAVERLRKPEDGTKREDWETPARVDAFDDAAMRDGTLAGQRP